jgi:hypothetical protein
MHVRFFNEHKCKPIWRMVPGARNERCNGKAEIMQRGPPLASLCTLEASVLPRACGVAELTYVQWGLLGRAAYVADVSVVDWG